MTGSSCPRMSWAAALPWPVRLKRDAHIRVGTGAGWLWWLRQLLQPRPRAGTLQLRAYGTSSGVKSGLVLCPLPPGLQAPPRGSVPLVPPRAPFLGTSTRGTSQRKTDRVCCLISCAKLLGVDPDSPTCFPSCSAEDAQGARAGLRLLLSGPVPGSCAHAGPWRSAVSHPH